MRKTGKKSTASEKKLQVRAELSNFQLAKAKSALRLQIYARGKKLGDLQVGRGSYIGGVTIECSKSEFHGVVSRT